MSVIPQEELEDFPHVGARARAFRRFERDLEAWLDTAEGRFATWYARAAVEADEPAS